MTGLRARLRPFVALASVCFRASPWRASGLVVAHVANAVLRLVAAYGVKLEVEAVVEGSRAGVWFAAAFMAVALVAVGFTSQVCLRLTDRVIDDAALRIDLHLMRLSQEITTIEHHERRRYLDQMTLIREDRQAMAEMVNAIVLNLRVVVAVAGMAVVLALIDPILFLLPVAGVLLVLGHRLAKQLKHGARKANAPRSRARDHLFGVATSAETGMELRLLGLAPELARRHRELSDEMEQRVFRATFVGWAVTALSSTAFIAVYAVALGVTLNRAIEGSTSIGDAVLTLTMFGLINAQMSSAALTAAYLQQVVQTGERLVWIEDYAAGRRESHNGGAAAVPRSAHSGIKVEGVSFRYPDSERVVLDDIDLDLPAGSCVALVGENGSGKSTLVKLLARMYAPTSGVITIDGVPIDRFDVQEWRQAMTASFQDFVRFELAVGESVGVGDLSALTDRDAIGRAIRRAGAQDFVAALPEAEATQLGRDWPGGVELSGGQWQKVAIGRALMRQAPLLTVMDEPAASLDAASEHELFERLARVRTTTAARGGVLLFVSHRFATVRTADLVVVMKGGRIEQVGTHDELTERGGLYRELYELQARAYR
jgi:ABC-type multidrug transport system fused ATPase/permease subunit